MESSHARERREGGREGGRAYLCGAVDDGALDLGDDAAVFLSDLGFLEDHALLPLAHEFLAGGGGLEVNGRRKE